MKKTLKKNLTYCLYAVISGFILASGFSLFIASKNDSNIFTIQSAGEIKIWLVLTLGIVFSLALFLIFSWRKCAYRSAVPLSLFCFTVLTLWNLHSQRHYYYIVMAAAVIILTFAYKEIFHDRKTPKLEGAPLYMTVLLMTIFMTSIVTMGSIIRMYSFNSSTFDFGLFAQMYESMATDLTQNTTLERNQLMSHFAVHFSPAYYLLLPFYMIFRRPEFLLAAQAAVCFSGVIPVLLICKRQRFDALLTIIISGVFLCYPAFTGGCFYDFHENFFLVPFILWLLYFLDKNSIAGTIIFGLLMLSVKEDAGLYVIFIGLYAVFNKKIKPSCSFTLLAIGVGGFLAVTSLIDSMGEGIKVSRYGNYLYGDQDSLTNVIFNVIKNPAFFFSSLLSEEKLLFILQMFLPLLFIPAKTRKLSDWFLIAPLVLINLATEYKYQADISFQYVFGTGALLIFLFIKNLRYNKKKTKAAAAAFMASAICLLGNSGPKFHYIDRINNDPDYYAAAREVLEEIPKDKVIYANTYLTPFLYDCKRVYMYPFDYYKNEILTDDYADYYVLDSRVSNMSEFDITVESIKEKGYEVESDRSFVLVLKKIEE